MSNRRVTVHMYVSHRLNESRPPGHRHNTVQHARHGAGMRRCAGPRTGRLGERSADHGALSGIHLAQLRAHVYTCVLNIGIYCYVWCIFYAYPDTNIFVWRLNVKKTKNKNEKDIKHALSIKRPVAPDCYCMYQYQTCIYFVVPANARQNADVTQTRRNLECIHTQLANIRKAVILGLTRTTRFFKHETIIAKRTCTLNFDAGT